MKIALVYISPNGTTRKTTNMIRDFFIKKGHEVQCIDLGSKTYRDNIFKAVEMIKSFDIVGFGSPVYHLDILPKMHKFIETLGFGSDYYKFKFETFIYVNYAGITSGRALLNAAKSINRAGLKIIGAVKIYAPHFFQKEELYSYKPSNKIEEFCKNITDEQRKFIGENQINKIFKAKKFFINIVYPFIHLIGKKRELPIIIDNEKCINCGKCIKECPNGALNVQDNLVKIDSKKCIHCYHCVSACRFQAVKSPIEKIEKIVNFNKKIIGSENPLNEIFLNYREEN